MYDSKQNIDVRCFRSQFCAEVTTCTWYFYPYKKCSCRVMKKISIRFHQGELIMIFFLSFFSRMAFSSFNLSQSFTWGVGGGGCGVLQISGDRDDRMGAKINPPKIPRASNKTPQKLWTKIKPPKNPVPNFGATKISRKHTYKI